MVTVLKTVFAFFGERGFESHPLRGLAGKSLTGTLLRSGMDRLGQVASLTIGFRDVRG
jgi:hypothetical protein